MNVTKAPTISIPTKKDTLCLSGAFLRYCKKQGIQATENDLNNLHGLNLLLPAKIQDGESYFSTYQHIVLKIILQQQHWQSDFKNDLSNSEIPLLREKIDHLYTMLPFFFEIQELDMQWMNAMREKFATEKEEIGEDQAVFEWPLIFNAVFLEKMRKDAISVLEKHNLTVEKVEGWRFQLSELCQMKRNQSLQQYLRCVPPEFLINAEETNKMICILNRYLWLFTDQRRTVKQVLLEMAERPCDICCAPIKQRPNKPEQHTCGRKECIAKRDAIQKKKKRALQKVASKQRV